jgi:hypothetical protein
MVVVVLVALVVVAAVLFGRWLVYRLSHSITGDAFVESDMINLAPQVAGEIVDMLVQDNQRVAMGERAPQRFNPRAPRGARRRRKQPASLQAFGEFFPRTR